MLFQSQLRPDRTVAVLLIAAVSTLAMMKNRGLYQSWVCSEFSRQAARIIVAAAVGGFALAASGWLVGSVAAAPAAPAAEGAAAAAALIIALRWRYRRWLKHQRADGQYLQTVVLVGTNEDAAAMWQMLSDEPELGYRVGGVVGKQAHLAPWQDLPHRSDLADLPQLTNDVGAEGVILVGSAVTSAESTVAVRGSLACGLHVQFWPGLAGVLSSRISTAPVSGLPMLYVEAHTSAGMAQSGEAGHRHRDRRRPASAGRTGAAGGRDRHPPRRWRASPLPPSCDWPIRGSNRTFSSSARWCRTPPS